MTMKPYKYIAFAFFALMAMSSCSDFLDKEPDQRIDIDSEDKVLKLLVSAYPSSNYALITEMSSDNLIDNNSPHVAAQPEEGKEDEEHYYNRPSYTKMDDELFAFEPVKSYTGSDSPSSIWQSYYSSIATANFALEAIEKMEKEQGTLSASMKAARAEARILRAYDHFILVNIFSQAYKDDEASKADIGVPYITKPEDKVHVDYDRSNVTETYKKIQEDLEAGLAELTDINFNKPKWRFNTNAAHAFAARFYLYKRDYDKVIEHANAVLGTDPATLPEKLINLASFKDCVTSTDYVNAWINPESNNNLFLVSTYSTYSRHLAGYRYAWNGTALKETIYHAAYGPGYKWWLWYVIPYYYASGGLFYSGNQDYGYFPMKIGESFEYTDKVAGVGYPHMIRREFTATALLLDRIEAKILSPHRDIEGAIADMIAYDNSRQSFSEEDKKVYTANGALNPLTEEIIQAYYSDVENPNCFENWDFTQRMSPSFVVPTDAVVYMNAVNDLRRFESVLEGTRFFDLKRYGIEYSHIIGPSKQVYKMVWNDPRRAIEVPIEALSAGLEPSRPILQQPVQGTLLQRIDYKKVNK